MALGPQTDVVNGSRFNLPTRYQFNPLGYTGQSTGVPQASPVMPPFIGAAGGGGGPTAYEGVGAYGTAGNNNTVTAIAAEHPHSLKVSPVWWWVFALLIGLWVLNAVHWRETILESVGGKAAVGGLRAEGSEEART